MFDRTTWMAFAMLALFALAAAACGGSSGPSASGDAATAGDNNTASAGEDTTNETPSTTATPEPTVPPTVAPDRAEATATPPDQPEPTAENATAPTPTPEPVPTAAADPTTAPPPVCTAPLEGSAANLSTLAVDADGDGATDAFSVYSVGPPARPSSWRVRIETATGASYDTELAVDPASPVGAEALGAGDVDGDATTEEVFVTVGAGAATIVLSIYTIAGCDLVPVTLAGANATFAVGGGVSSIAGLECVDSEDNGVTNNVVAWTGTLIDEDDRLFGIEGTEYQLFGTELTTVGTISLEVRSTEADFDYNLLNCPRALG